MLSQRRLRPKRRQPEALLPACNDEDLRLGWHVIDDVSTMRCYGADELFRLRAQNFRNASINLTKTKLSQINLKGAMHTRSELRPR